MNLHFRKYQTNDVSTPSFIISLSAASHGKNINLISSWNFLLLLGMVKIVRNINIHYIYLYVLIDVFPLDWAPN